MAADLEFHIKNNYLWGKLPLSVRQHLGNEPAEYEKAVVQYCVRNQLRFKESLVSRLMKGERRYYEQLLSHSRERLMLYPYHLQDIFVKGLRVTPFSYYLDMLADIMNQEKSYDSLPNFTAADCLRLLGIGRNQYIELMNQCRSTRKFFGVGLRKRNVRDLLPTHPVDSVPFQPWWRVRIGSVMEEDVRVCMLIEKRVIDLLIDHGPQLAGALDHKVLQLLYRKGLVYLEVPIEDEDHFIVPTLEGFVMNRVTGDYLETLLYKIFVSIDEHTSVAELANVLQIDLKLVKNAVSLFCRLGFAYKKVAEGGEKTADIHSSWHSLQGLRTGRDTRETSANINEWNCGQSPTSTSPESCSLEGNSSEGTATTPTNTAPSLDGVSGRVQKIGFLFDSTLTAYLMMGNLSPGLKNHAVTMFEVGKLNDESLDGFLSELDRVQDVGEGEARRYYEHAVNLRDTLRFLRYNTELAADDGQTYGLDLLRCESLLSLDPSSRLRILKKNYRLLISMAPISYEDRTIISCSPAHIGPPIPEVNSVWFKLFLYQLSGSGPPSLLLVRGSKLRTLPTCFHAYSRLWVTTWNHDPVLVATSNVLLTINEALMHNPVLVQAYDSYERPLKKSYMVFPAPPGPTVLLDESLPSDEGKEEEEEEEKAEEEGEEEELQVNGTGDGITVDPPAVVEKLREELELRTMCGFVTLLRPSGSAPLAESEAEEAEAEAAAAEAEPILLDLHFGVPLFSKDLNRAVCTNLARLGVSRSKESELMSCNRRLVLRLLKFIAEVNGQSAVSLLEAEGDRDVPLPCRNLLFYKGRLSCPASLLLPDLE